MHATPPLAEDGEDAAHRRCTSHLISQASSQLILGHRLPPVIITTSYTARLSAAAPRTAVTTPNRLTPVGHLKRSR